MAVPAMTQLRFSLPSGGTPVPRAWCKFDRMVNFVRAKKPRGIAKAMAERSFWGESCSVDRSGFRNMLATSERIHSKAIPLIARSGQGFSSHLQPENNMHDDSEDELVHCQEQPRACFQAKAVSRVEG